MEWSENQLELTRRQWATLIVLTVSTFVVVLDASVVNIALPVIVADLGGSLGAATWVLAGFVLSFAALLLPGARLADLHGRRRMFVLGMAVFTAASQWCAISGSLERLVAARVVQGAELGLRLLQRGERRATDRRGRRRPRRNHRRAVQSRPPSSLSTLKEFRNA